MELELDWDENKARANLSNHRVSLPTAAEIFVSEILERVDDREDHGETRLIALGKVDTEVYRVVFTSRRENLIRIISSRKRAEMNEGSTIVRSTPKPDRSDA